jgi:hypothetical protein
VQHGPEPAPELDVQGPVEAELELHGAELIGGRVLAQDHHRRVAGQHLRDRENGQRDDEEDDQDRGQAPEEVGRGHPSRGSRISTRTASLP